MGDGTERKINWRRPVRKADINIVFKLLPYIYELESGARTLRQIAEQIKQNHPTHHSIDQIVSSLKVVNDKVGILGRDGHIETGGRIVAYYYKPASALGEASSALIQFNDRYFKTPLVTEGQQGPARTSLEDFI